MSDFTMKLKKGFNNLKSVDFYSILKTVAMNWIARTSVLKSVRRVCVE